MLLTGKVVLITGASRGIGAACAESFGRRGAQLSLAARSPISQPGALSTQADLTLPEAREALVRRTLDHYGRVDILINNAGDGLYSPTELTGLDQARRMFELNLFAAVGMVQLVCPGMRAQRSGTIVNVTSIAAAIPLPWMTLYSASKAALSSVTRGLRRELRGSRIKIMEVQPGYVLTEFQDHAAGQPPPGVLKHRHRAITAARCGEAIARGVERGARTVVTPPSGWFAIALERVLPSVIDSALGRINE
ncbi:MAG: SDR family NAD(P)-dependent oxidoreductase [Acidobacteriota bacterium]|nr:SDR family NAD(P)-dependent oxidoreductase [Acidobacteriota bacterium]